MSQSAIHILESFETISLEEMDSVKLMNRTDTKFTFTESQLSEILPEILKDYRVLQIDGKRCSTYKTLYYDTKDFNLYLHHHSGQLNRYKVRHRTYLDSGTGYLEVKFKSNKGRTIKERIKNKITPVSWEETTSGFLKEKTPFDPEDLQPAIWVNYKRITLVSKTAAERVTLDVELEFVDGNNSQKMHNLVIAEVKQDKKTPSVFIKKMKELHIREGSISKYCLGIALTHPELKMNNFKEKILSLKKLLYDQRINFAGC